MPWGCKPCAAGCSAPSQPPGTSQSIKFLSTRIFMALFVFFVRLRDERLVARAHALRQRRIK